jgi:uracil-DNA glycosylase family 4
MKFGFFDLGNGENPNHERKKSTVTKKIGCDACGLYDNCETPYMKIKGKGRKGIFFIVENPTDSDDQKNQLLSGFSGDLLKEILYENNIDLYDDCYTVSAIRCFTGKPQPKQAGNCRHKLLKDITEKSPKVIISLGTLSIQALIGHRLAGRISGSSFKYENFYGEQIPDQELKTYVCPTYSPVFLMKYDDPVMRKQFKEHVQSALNNCLTYEQFPLWQQTKVKITTNESEAIEFLKSLKNEKRIAFDYETTGIKPDREGHELVCVSIATEKDCFSFPFFQSPEFLKEWEQVITNKRIGKIAHNIGFENSWTKHCVGSYVNRWTWDTCLGQHIQNNRQPTNLKFTTYIKFGIMGYDEEVDKFITTNKPGQEDNNTNNFNCINEAPMDKLLYYCGLDSIFSYELYKIQRSELSDKQKEGMKLFLKGAEELSKIHRTGMCISRPLLIKYYKELSQEIEQKEKDLKKTKDWKAYGSHDFNYNSNDQLKKLLYDILKLPKPDGKKSVDEKALTTLNIPFTKKILEIKKIKNLRDTYIDGFRREAVKGKIHPFFNLSTVKTFRSSANAPNFQNIPKRNKTIKNKIRSIIIPRPGNKIIEYDYKGVEVSIGACVHKDPNMITYILDESTDMHRDTAMDLFFRTEKTILKEERQTAKNGMVFPAFYGSSSFVNKKSGETVGNITKGIWEQLGEETFQHLRDNGIKNIEQFQKHVEQIENVFWGERFEVYSEWKNEVYEQYRKDGYVDLLSGFRCYGPMKKTEVCNYPIQGAAFHCLLWTVNHVNDLIHRVSGRSHLIGQVHDCIVVDCHPDDESEVDNIIKTWGTEKIREYWDWIIVPLKIEKERTQLNGSWAEIEDCGYL